MAKKPVNPEVLAKKWMVLATLVCIGILAAAVVFWHALTESSPQLQTKSFDSTKWKAVGDACDLNNFTRVQMVNDLLWNHHFIGMSRGSIDDLLGPPTKKEGGGYQYCLGPQRSWMVLSHEWLSIDFLNDICTGFKVTTD